MASGFFAVLDDIAALMDDVDVTSKIAKRKTAGILGDDLDVNAEKAKGFLASSEVQVRRDITTGSFINHLIIVLIPYIYKAFFLSSIKYTLYNCIRFCCGFRRYSGIV